MWKSQVQAFWLSFTDIFNTKDDDAKGRVINLGCTLLAAFYNVFITGIFYTGFLSMYGISITGAGIVTFMTGWMAEAHGKIKLITPYGGKV